MADIDGADMESAPTFVNMVWHNDKFMQMNIVDVLIVFCNFDLPYICVQKVSCKKGFSIIANLYSAIS